MNGSRAQRYRPAAEFDDATLARKREYWRTKKREQRAKLSARKKEKLVAKGATNCKLTSAASVESSEASEVLAYKASSSHSLKCCSYITAPFRLSGPPLLNSDGSYQAAASLSPPDKGSVLSTLDGVQDWERTSVMASYNNCILEERLQTMTDQKERGLQRAKLHKTTPQFPKICLGSVYEPSSAGVSKDVVRCLPVDAERGTFSTAKPNGTLFSSCSQVPAAQMDLQFNSSLYNQDQNDTSLVNGSSASTLSQHHTEPPITLGQASNCCTQISINSRESSISLLKVDVATKAQVIGHSQDVVTSQIPGIKSTNKTPLIGKNKPPSAVRGTQPIGVTATLETEEEKAARRREYWRIKKREQRAKSTTRLAKLREKTKNMTTVMQKTELSSCMLQERPSAWCKDGLRQPPNRVRTPLIPVSLQRAGRLLRNARAVAVSCSASKYSSITVKNEPSHSYSILSSPATSGCNHPAVSTKTEKMHESTILKVGATSTLTHPKLQNTFGHQKRQDTDEPWGFARPKTPRQRLLEIQRMASQRSIRKSSFHATTLLTPHAKRGHTEETAEEKLARKREYWRVKKREQRAKLSAEVKARLKERDALLRRVKRYQCILEEMRKARAGDRALQPAENALAGETDAIGGFIKEDGTVTTEIPQASSQLKLSGSEMTPELQTFRKVAVPVQSANVSVNADKAGAVSQMQVNVSPSFYDSTQVKDSHQHIVTRTVFRSAAKNLKHLHAAPQISETQKHPQDAQNTYPRITLIKPTTNVPQISSIAENVSLRGVKERSGFMLAPSASEVTVTVPCQTAQLTEEEKMAKKREYWRLKKREQRAKRSARGKVILGQQNHRMLLTRNTVTLPLGKSTPPRKPVAKPDIELPVSPEGNVKQERDSSSADDCPASQLSLCEDIKPSPLSPSKQQTEPDMSLSMDSQEATLLAVASMKKLLEESLSTVMDCNGLSSCKSEEDAGDLDIKPHLLCSLGGSQETITPGQMQQEISTCSPKSPCESQAEGMAGPPSRHIPAEVPSTSQVPASMPLSDSDPSPKAPCSKLPLVQPSPPRRALRLRPKRTGHCCSSEPTKPQPASAQSDEDILQKKREYWRVMKREQRARKAAREKEVKRQTAVTTQEEPCWGKQEQMANKAMPDQELRREGQTGASKPILPGKEAPKRLEQQGPSICLIKPDPPLQRLLPTGDGSLVSSLSTLLVMSPKSDGFHIEPDAANSSDSTGQMSPAYSATEGRTKPEVEVVELPGADHNKNRLLLLDEDPGPSPKSARVRRWRLQVTEGVDTQPKQLTSHPHTQTPPSGGAVGLESRRRSICQNPTTKIPLCVKQGGVTHNHAETPKAVRTFAESEEDLRQKKREYWRGRKREQRARKAARERQLKLEGATGLVNSAHTGSGVPEDLGQIKGQDSSQWFSGTEKTELRHCTSSVDDLGLLPQLCQMGGVKDDTEVVLLEEEEDEDEGSMGTPTSAATWRSRFLMDYDPLNQLLVCMVCGELQHSHTLDAVRAHIEETHPDTASLGPCEHRHIQEAWDEQVSVRERFFSSQMQQQGAAVTEVSDDSPAEVEVLVDQEDFRTVKNSKSKNKSMKKV